MQSNKIELKPFFKFVTGEESIAFVLLARIEDCKTRENKHFFKVTFCDSVRRSVALIWSGTPNYISCSTKWRVGEYYKIQAVLRENKYGQRLELHRIRPVVPLDGKDGFDPRSCHPRSMTDPEILFDELLSTAESQIGKTPLLALVRKIYKDYRSAILDSPGDSRSHHLYAGGLLEHTLSVLKVSLFLADIYRRIYPEEKQLISKPLVAAGASLHDIGRIASITSAGLDYIPTVRGDLFGSFLLGRDLIRENCQSVNLDSQTQLHLEHIVMSHLTLPESEYPHWPMSLEAIIVAQADMADSVCSSAIRLLKLDDSPDESAIRRGPFGVPLFKPGNWTEKPGDRLL